MNKKFKYLKSKLGKLSIMTVAGVITFSLAYGANVQNNVVVVENFPNIDDDNDSIMQDKVDLVESVEIISSKSIFNKKENTIHLKWDSSKTESKYKIYKLATEGELNKCKEEDVREVNGKKFVLFKEVQECELEFENVYKPNTPRINIPKEFTNEIEVKIESGELPLIDSYYVESIDKDGNIVEKTEEIEVGLENTIKGYSYIINSNEEDEPDEKVDTKENTIKIKLDDEKKYLHVRAIDINGIAGKSVTIELPEAVSNEDNSQIIKIVRTNKINHSISPSNWTNKDVDIDIHAINKKGFKQITYPDGIIEDLTTSELHLYGGEGRDELKNVAPTKDGGFIAVGESNSSTFNGEKLSLVGGMDAIIVKYDEGGNIEWLNTWGKAGDDVFHGVTEVVENNTVVGYVAVGQSDTENTFNSVVVRFDSSGNKIWEDIVPGVAVDEVLWDVIQDSSGRIVTAGWHTSNINDDKDGIIRIYELGSPHAIKVVTSPYDIPSEKKWFSEGYDAIKEVPGGYIVVGSSREYNASSKIYEPRVGRIVKFDKELNILWNKTFKGAYDLDKELDFDNVMLTSDGNIVVIGDGSVDKGEDVLEEAKGDRDGFIIKFNIKDGSVIWSKRFGGSGEEQMYGIQERSNGDLVVIGKTSSTDKDFSGTIKDTNGMKLDDVFIMTFAGDTGEKVGAVSRIGGIGNDVGWAIRTLNDGRLVLVGTTTSGQSQGNDAFVCFAKGTTDINTKYTVSENGTYKFKFIDVSNEVHNYSVTISNIDKESPQIVLSGETDNGVYKINAKITDNVGVAVQKWASGEQDIDYFSENNGNVFTGNEIEVDSKTTYTVYARDLAGNEQIAVQSNCSIALTTTANPKDNNMLLDWKMNTNSNSKDFLYKPYAKRIDESEFKVISATDYSSSTEKVKVLNIYPAHKNIPNITFTTWEGKTYTLPKSANVKQWMEEPNDEHPKGYGKGIITVDSVTNEESALESDKITVEKKGLLNEFPWEIGGVGTVLTIPQSHSTSNFAYGDIWMTFKDWHKQTDLHNLPENLEKYANFYLTTWKNTAMIQTGHSNGDATADEQKLLANTLFYLNQLNSETSVIDNGAKDINAPNAPRVSFQEKSKFSFMRQSNKQLEIQLSAQDVGTVYQHYVEGISKVNVNEIVRSNTTMMEIKTGVKGYSYIVDNSSSTIPDSVIDTEDSSISIDINPDHKTYIHVKAIDGAGNESEVTHLKLQDGGLPSIKLSSKANHQENYIDLKWETDIGVDSYICKVYGKKVGDKDFQPISSVDFERNDPVKVLNVYPTKGVPMMSTFTTWDGEVVSGLPQSAQLKKWMEEPNEYSSKGYGKGIIEVMPISIESFNSNPVDAMKNADGSWKYDVIMFGTWDSYCDQDISNSSLEPLKQFMDEGYGVLFGHDYLTDPIYSGNRGTLASYANITYGGKIYNGQNTNSAYPGVGNSEISIYRKGVLTNFPWQLGEVGTKLSVPATHTSYQFANGYIWMKFDYNGHGLSDNNNFYLTSSDNVAMIQTGHSNGQATSDEQKVMANTLFYLKQLFSLEKREAEDRNGIDLDAPTMPTIKSESARKFSLLNWFKKVVRLELTSEDLGTTYEHYVEGINKFNSDQKVKSNVTSIEIKTGVKGYSYIIDTKVKTEPDNIVDIDSGLLTLDEEDTKGKYIHVKAIDYAGNASETLHYRLDEIGINTDYAITNGNVTELDGSKVSSLLKGENYRYSFDVSNLNGTPFIESFGGSGDEYIYKTIVHDGDYISVGHTTSTNYDFSGLNKGRDDAFIVKHNNKGEIIWKKTLGGSGQDFAMSVMLVENGYIVVGYSNSTDGDFSGTQAEGSTNAYIMEVDFNGNKKWSNQIYLPDWDVANSVVQRNDGGYIIVGSTQSHPNFSSTGNTNDILVIGISAKGATEYVKYIGGNLKDMGEVIVDNEDGTYTIIGQTYSTSGLGVHKGGEDGVLIKIDEKGNVLKIKNFGGTGNDHFRAIHKMDNGDMVIVGYTESNDKDLAGVKSTLDRDGLIVMVDKNFNTKWIKVLGGSKNEWLLAVYTDDTGIMTSGFGGSNDGVFAGLNKGGEDAIIARFSLDGEFEWARSFGGSGEERLRTMVQTPEGGYMIGGDTTSKDGDLAGIINRGVQDALLVKFNPDGTFGTLKSDNEISTIDYKIEVNASGVKTLIKEGSYKNQIVNPGETITNTVDFKVPQTSASEILITTELKDSQDSNLSNNKMEIRVPLVSLVETDFSLENDKILDENGAEKEEVEVGLEYKYNFDVSNIDTTPFIKTFGGSGNEHFEKHILTSDGGILGVGRTNSTNQHLAGMNNGGNDAFIVKIDEYGEIEWKDSFGGSKDDMFYHVVEVSDGFIAVGQTASIDKDIVGTGYNESVTQNNIMVKYNKSGKILWKKAYADSGTTSNRGLIIRADASENLYVLENMYSSLPSNKTVPAVVKYDKDGNRKWRVSFGSKSGAGLDGIFGLDLAKNGDILISGKYGQANGDFANMPNLSGPEAYVARISPSGQVKWKIGLSGSGIDDARQVAEAEDGSLIVIGRTDSNDGPFAGKKKPLSNKSFASDSNAGDATLKKQDGWVAKLTSSGRLLNPNTDLKVIGGGGYDNLRCLSVMKDGKFLISGDTASTDGDFKDREDKGQGYTDSFWLKIDKNLNVNWISILGGNKDDATQSGLELPDGSIVVAGETKSTTGDFAGLNKGGQDAFIARLNADGELIMYPHDELISSIKYNVTWSDGVNDYPVKSGSLEEIHVPVGETVNKEIEFEVPRDARIKTMTLSAEILDENDANSNNNRITKTVDVLLNRDYLFEGYNVKEQGKSSLCGTLRKDTVYELNLKLKNSLLGVEDVKYNWLSKNKISEKGSYIPQIDSLKYKIVCTDGLNSQDVASITLDNVKGTILAEGEKKNIKIEDQSSVWEKITFETLDDGNMSEVIFVAEIQSLDDGDTTNNRFVVKLPIVNKEESEVSIDEVTIYPGAGEDDGDLIIGNEMNVKVVLSSTTLKTSDVDVKLYIEDGNKRVEMDKKAFGVSKEYPGVVYFKYQPENIGTIKVVTEIETVYGEESFGPTYAYVEKSKDPKEYATASEKREDKYDILADVVTYLKTQKRDKDVVKTKYCADKTNCQHDFDGDLVCPGHEYWDWGDWYNAYVPVKSTELNGFEESYEIKSVLFRSKETEKMVGDIEGVNTDGTVDLMNEESSKLAYIKAGYGFELKVETEYKNNLPELMKKAAVANIAPSNTDWSQYKIIQHNQSSIPFIYHSEKLNGIDSLILSNKGVVSFTVPSLDDIIIENPDQLYLKMPDNEYLMVDEGYGEVYGDDVSTNLEVANTSNKRVAGNSYFDTKIVEFKKTSGDVFARRNYYISDDLKDGKHQISIFNRYSGYGAANNNKLHVNNSVEITIKGGKYDDIIDMAQ